MGIKGAVKTNIAMGVKDRASNLVIEKSVAKSETEDIADEESAGPSQAITFKTLESAIIWEEKQYHCFSSQCMLLMDTLKPWIRGAVKTNIAMKGVAEPVI